MTNDKFRQALRLCLQHAGLTLGELACRAGLPKSTVARVAEGSAMPSALTFARLVEGLDLTDSERLRLLSLAAQ